MSEERGFRVGKGLGDPKGGEGRIGSGMAKYGASAVDYVTCE